MRKSFDVKEGDKIVYLSGYTARESEVVSKPIDEANRPLFRMGRIDLANGDYLVKGTMIYDSIEEAEKTIIEKLNKDIEIVDEKISFYSVSKQVMEMTKNDLLKKYKNEN